MKALNRSITNLHCVPNYYASSILIDIFLNIDLIGLKFWWCLVFNPMKYIIKRKVMFNHLILGYIQLCAKLVSQIIMQVSKKGNESAMFHQINTNITKIYQNTPILNGKCVIFYFRSPIIM